MKIAAQLDRDPKSVQDFIKRKFKVGANEEQAVELDERPYWIEVKQQFTEDEQNCLISG